MEYWEFLLQKEGDHTWLPLESSQVEILEGRYRVIVHASQRQVSVQIRISQILTEQLPPRRRVLKRTGEINEKGLMVVMPFTWLRAGTWDIYCAIGAAAPPSTLGEYAIQLRVLSHEGESDDDWLEDPWHDAPAPSSVHASADAQATGGLSEDELNTAFENIDRALAQAVANQREVSVPGALALRTRHRIELTQSALVAHQGQFTVVGKVLSEESATLSAQAIIALRLTDPQTLEVLEISQQPISQAKPFALSVNLPGALKTQLLLGEAVLAESQSGRAHVLAVQRFTVTVDVSSLLDAIANKAENGDFDIVFPDGPLAEFPFTDPLEAKANSAAPHRTIPTLLLPRGGSSLPPKIYYPSPHESLSRKPVLPPLDQSALTSAPSDALEANSANPHEAAAKSLSSVTPSSETPSTESSKNSSEQTAPSQNLTLDLPSFARKPPSAAQELMRTPKASPKTPGADPDASPAPPEIDEFRALNLQERFWSHLNALVAETQQMAINQVGDAPTETESSLLDLSETDPPKPGPFAGEVVVYDDETASDLEESGVCASAADSSTSELTELNVAPKSLDAIISPPEPEIEVSKGELIAGAPLPVTLRIPFHCNRVYLKLWIADPQTRSLVEEPRRLMRLIPDGHDHLEAIVQLQVPEGCTEIHIEAIAVDMSTHQESYKTSIRRSVIPPSLSELASEDFEV